MSAIALGLVLLAALMHASWNAMVKANGDRAIVLAGVSFIHVVVGAGLALSAPMPAPESWPFIVASTIIHFFYYTLIFFAYRWGDLSHVYPISRGIAPALVAFGAWAAVGETLTPRGWAGLATVTLGILLLASVDDRRTARCMVIEVGRIDALAEQGVLKPNVSARFRLEDSVDALRMLAKGSVTGKIVVTM